MKEYEMSKPVEEYFKSHGYEVYCEVPYYGYCIDMVLKKDSEICCVELYNNISNQYSNYKSMRGAMGHYIKYKFNK